MDELNIKDMRDATDEEKESTKRYIDNSSVPTGLNFYELLEEKIGKKNNKGVE